ncbi:MAG: biopolymer transporter ExbD [Paludibacteraceae bacterium]|jgi:biopolymer transport protein ExbD|nr:biopolymer transporter ExbD [Paludibacteraceae bacterium]
MANKRKLPEINASQMADISFLLLIFWLCSTTMSTDQGLSRRLPPPLPPNMEKPDVEVNERNIFIVLINSQNQLLVQGELMDVRQLREEAKAFILNTENDIHKPELFEVTADVLDKNGNVERTLKTITTKNHVISLQNDRGTTYDKYIEVQNELVAAYNEVRDEYSRREFAGLTFNELTPEQQEAVQTLFPQKISEAEPKNYGGKK